MQVSRGSCWTVWWYVREHEGRYGGVCQQEHWKRRCGSSWETQKSIKVKLETGKTSVRIIQLEEKDNGAI